MITVVFVGWKYYTVREHANREIHIYPSDTDIFTCKTIVGLDTMSSLYAATSRAFRSSKIATRRIVAAVRVAATASEVRGGFDTELQL